MERLPKTAATLDEPGIRDLILFVLNANYEGQASGEVFSGNGKTDIFLNWAGKAAFIGECKIWDGAKVVQKALDQLLGYTVWRDTKAALVVFIRRRDASAVIRSAVDAVTDHSNHLESLPNVAPERRRDFVFRSARDPERRITLALMPVVLAGSDSA